ncbi:site-specific DNA-methyltransferase [Burkholderia gladioli]|uniref:site-specific DNA-methyltransferase n=1 Tax=Burkholderia gladioli TaxID=28095 RepID=UPI00163EC191|nr:site-specific DNA-methyltransferase [Burkholderia gladioli]MBJ9673356.1 chromosome partitioning protein ParB [Burkholderia gladioli]MDN7464171.1 site-specific DNA-methyltransferase [Burkholderia gladioli]
MQISSRSIDSLIPYARNARTHSESQVAQIAGSIEEFGMVGAIVVRDGVIAKGHGTLAAIRMLYSAGKRLYPPPGRSRGAEPFPDGEAPVLDASGWTDAQFRAFVVADNQLALLAGWDDELLRLEVAELLDEGFDVDLLGFEPVELGTLLDGQEDGPALTERRKSLLERFLIAPFSVFNAREGWWQDRKQSWIALGLESETGRDSNLTFSSSAQPPAVYAAKNAYTVLVGRDVTWDEFYAANPATRVQGSTSIFDPVLCEIVYRWFCPPGGVVLDPFAGGSVRGVVAAMLGRPYVGCDLRAEQIGANRAQWEAIGRDDCPAPAWHVGDSRELVRHIGIVEADLVFSCPPYADLEVYSDDPADLSNMTYPDFLAGYRAVIAAAVAQLRQDRFACFVVGEVRDRKGIYRNFVADTIDAFRDAGLHYYNEAILVTQAGSLPTRVGRSFPVTRKIGKTHQNVLIFVKGDPRAAAAACGEVDVAMPDECGDGDSEKD